MGLSRISLFARKFSGKPALKWFFLSLFLGTMAFTGAQAQLALGGSYSFSVTFTAGNWNSVTVSAPVPADFTYVSCAGAPSCAYSGGTVYWYMGNLTSGQAVSVTYSFIVTSCQVNSGSVAGTISVGSPVTTIVATPIGYTVNCPTYTPTITPTPTSTGTSTFTPTVTNSPTVTQTSTVTFTPTVTWTPTVTYTPTVTFTPTDTPTATPTLVPLHVWPIPFDPRFAWNHELIAYQVPPGVTMSIFTVSGELAAGPLAPDGTGHIYWKGGLNNQGIRVSTGTYFYVIQQGNSSPLLTGKVLVVMDQ